MHEGAEDPRVDRALDVGVVEDDVGVVAAEFHRRERERAGRVAGDAPSH